MEIRWHALPNAVRDGARFASLALIAAVALRAFSVALSTPCFGIAAGLFIGRVIVKMGGPSFFPTQLNLTKWVDRLHDPLTASALWTTSAAFVSCWQPLIGGLMGTAVGSLRGLTVR